MQNPLCLRVAVCLIWGTLAVAQSEPNQPRTATAALGGIDVLSDTMGVDFSSYLQRVLKTVKESWYHLAPPSAKAPKMTKGVVTIESAILKKGKVAGMKLVEETGDIPMGGAAWHAITDSRFPPLPAEFPGQYLALRFHFVYTRLLRPTQYFSTGRELSCDEARTRRR